MTAPSGFDILTGTAEVSLPITSGLTLLTLAVPARWTVGTVILEATQLDTDTAPGITLNVGDAGDVDRFLAASTVARDASEAQEDLDTYYRYAAASSVLVKCGTIPATGAAGSVTLSLYGYLSADYSVLRRTVLRELGVLAEGQSVLSEDDAMVREALEEVHATLAGRQLANKQDLAWTLDAVPMFASRPYAVMAAWRLCGVFGVPMRREQTLAAKAGEAEREIRRQTYARTSGDPVPLEPYDDGTLSLDYGALV